GGFAASRPVNDRGAAGCSRKIQNPLLSQRVFSEEDNTLNCRAIQTSPSGSAPGPAREIAPGGQSAFGGHQSYAARSHADAPPKCDSIWFPVRSWEHLPH